MSLVIGFLFADDSTDVVTDTKMLRQAWGLAGKWAKQWGMSFGPPKSGVMATPGIHDRRWNDPTTRVDKDGIVSRRPPPAAGAGRATKTPGNPSRSPGARRWTHSWMTPPPLSGERVNVVLWHESLGSFFHGTLSLVPTILENVRKAKARVDALQQFLASGSVPTKFKQQVTSGNVIVRRRFG